MWVHIKQLPKIQQQLKAVQLRLQELADQDESDQRQDAA
jgi:hypothetical protein